MPADFDMVDAPRFEPLQASRGSTPALPFSAWRGRSGRRYVVTVYSPETAPDLPGVVLVVKRGEGGSRRILRAFVRPEVCAADDRTGLTGLLRGADEVHLHLVAGGDAARRRVLRDVA